MHKKMIILVVIMLLIMPVSAVAEKIFKSVENPTVLSDDTPNWQNGDLWKYDCEFEGELGDAMNFNWAFNDITFTVDDSSGSSYSMSITGGVTGEITLFEIQLVSGTLQSTAITGTASVAKSNIGLEEIDAVISGKIAVAGIPIKSFTMNIDVTFDPPYCAVDFPISVGKTWTIPISDISGTADISILENPIIIDDIIGGDQAECTGMKTVSVPAGSFEAYEIITSGDVAKFYYASEAGNVIQAIGDDGNLVGIELKQTTYGSTPGAPNRPSKPSGPSSGSPGTKYTYSSSTTDNEGDQVYYLFNWGDGTDSGWIGPYSSGSTCQVEKTWSRSGTFAVKVKAKDTDDHESQWSESLSVSMPRNRAVKTYITKLFDIFLNNFPRLHQLLKT